MIRTIVYTARELVWLSIRLLIFILRQAVPYECPCCHHPVNEVKSVSRISPGSHYYRCPHCKYEGWADAPEPHWFSANCVPCDKHGRKQ